MRLPRTIRLPRAMGLGSSVYVIIGLIFLSFHELLGQTFEKGFIVTNSNDTLQGYIRVNQKFSSTCEFSKSFGGSFDIFGTADIQAFGFQNGTRFVSNQHTFDYQSSRPMFLQLIVDGEIPLVYNGIYALRKNGYWSELRNEFGVKLGKVREGQDIIEQNGLKFVKDNKEYLSILSALLVNECFSLSTSVSKVRYTHKSLSKFLKSYCDCTNKKFVSYTEKKSFEIGFMVGLSRSKDIKNLTVFSAPDFSNASATATSMDYRLKLASRTPIANSRLKAELGIQYSNNKKYLINYTDVRPSTEDFYETRFKYSLLTFELNFNYYLPVSSRMELFGGGGVGMFNIIQSGQSRLIEVEQIGETILIDGSDFFSLDKSTIFLTQSVGLNYSLKYGHRLILELYHNNSNSPISAINDGVGPPVRIRNLNSLGVRIGYSVML